MNPLVSLSPTQKAFLSFASKVLEGHEGSFFSTDRQAIGAATWVFGWGEKKKADFDKGPFPIFITTDWRGKEQQAWHFEYSLTDEAIDEKALETVYQVLESGKKLSLSKPLVEYASETSESFTQKVEQIQNFQREGEAWVMNLTQNIFGDLCSENVQDKALILLSSFYHFLKTGASHCGGVTITNEQKFCSFSPEVFIAQKQDGVSSFPIKGTGEKQHLQHSDKEQAELSMVTDLLRNDLGQVCHGVRVLEERFLTNEGPFYHAQSHIEGVLSKPFNKADFGRLLPAGSISGAPKARVVEKILELENFDRHYYTGTFGVRWSPDRSVFNILIRTLFFGEKNWYFPVGAGITIDSCPKKEFQETLDKASSLERFCLSN